MITQVFQGKTYHFHPPTKRYRRREGPRGAARQFTLHRDAYSDVYGNIPHGWHVHHRDEDPHNNAVENLVAMAPLDHQREHPTRSRHTLACQGCGSLFEAGRINAKWCSPYCKEHARVPRRK